MRMRSEAHRYGAVAIIIHWASALVILGLLASGIAMENIDDAARVGVLRAHVLMGILVVALTLARIAWWVFADRRPADIPGQPRLQALASWLVHRLFYVVILVMGASGIAMIALSGAGETLFAGASTPLPDFNLYAPRIPHGIGAWSLVALVVLHVGAALYHQFVLRDRLLSRMGIGAPQRP